MARVLQKLLAAADLDLNASEKRPKTSAYISNFDELLDAEDYHSCLRHVSSVINEIDNQPASEAMSGMLVELLLVRAALNFKLGHADECFIDAQKALRRDRQSLAAYHLSYLALQELNELVKALAHLCKCFSLASSSVRRLHAGRAQADAVRLDDHRRLDGGRVACSGSSLESIVQTDLTDSKGLDAEAVRQDLFHFALRTIQHVPGALDTADSVVAPTDLPGVLTGIARGLYAKQQFELSAFILEAVIVLCKKATGDFQRTLLCALESLAEVYSALDMHDRALAILARYQTLASEMESWSDVAAASSLQARAHRAVGNFQRCEQCLHDRMDVLRTQVSAVKDSGLDLVATKLELASVCQSQLRMHTAIGHGESALSLARTASDRPSLIQCHLTLGRLRHLLGLNPQAIFHFKTCLTVSRKAGSVRGQAWALYGLAGVYDGLLRRKVAMEHCKTLLSLPAADPHGQVSDDGESESAENSVEFECRCRALLLLGRLHHGEKQLETASGFLDEARYSAEGMKDWCLQARVDCAAAAVACDQGHFMRSSQLLKSAMDVAKSEGDYVLQMNCHYHLGMVISRGRLRSQLTPVDHFQSALDLFSQLRQQHGSWSADGKSVVELPLDCFEWLQECLVGRGDIKEAFLVAEYAHQRVFLDTVGVHQDLEDVQTIRMQPVKMPTLADLSRRIAGDGCGVLLYSTVHDALYMWLCLPPRGLAAGVFTFHQWSAGAVRYLLPFLRQNYLLLSRLPPDVRDASRTCESRSCCLVGGEAMMYRSASAGQVIDKQGDPPPYCPYGSVAQRQQLAYPWIGDEELIHPGRSSYLASPAPREDINGIESRASMRDLYSVLALPFERYLFGSGSLPVRDITIVANNAILLCPFSALVTSRRVVVLDYYHYQFRCTPCLMPPVCHTAQSCDQCLAQGGATGGGVRALVAGNPTVPTVKFFGQSWRPLPLPYAEREVRSIGLLLGPNVNPLLGTAARRQALISLMPRASLIHLAMHISWELCSFVVAPAAGVGTPTEKDVLLTASDIGRMHLQADLVVLSGGSAYVHSSRPSAGLPQPTQHNLPSSTSLLTMVRAFLTAGARCVLTPLWSIPDRATDEFMFLFYEHLKQGTAVGQALRLAMESVRSKRGFSEPVNWASFIHFGEDVCLDFSSVEDVGVSRSPSLASMSEAAGDTASGASEAAAGGLADPPGESRPRSNAMSPMLIDLSNSPVPPVRGACHGKVRVCLRRGSATLGHRSAFDSIKWFLEVIAGKAEVAVEGVVDNAGKAAVTEAIASLVKAISHSIHLLSGTASGPSSTVVTPPSSSHATVTSLAVANSDSADVEQMALDCSNVHGLLVCLGFVFNHHSEADDYSLHFPDSKYFVPAHVALLKFAEVLEEFVLVSPFDIVKSFFAILPIQLPRAVGVLHMLRHPWDKPATDAVCLQGAWENRALRALLNVLGFEETPASAPGEDSAGNVVTLEEDACRESVHLALAQVLELLTGDIEITVTSDQWDALSPSAWGQADICDPVLPQATDTGASHSAVASLGSGEPSSNSSLPNAAKNAATSSGTSASLVFQWDSVLDGSLSAAPLSPIRQRISAPSISQSPGRAAASVAASRSDPTAGGLQSSFGSCMGDIDDLLMQLGVVNPAASTASDQISADVAFAGAGLASPASAMAAAAADDDDGAGDAGQSLGIEHSVASSLTSSAAAAAAVSVAGSVPSTDSLPSMDAAALVAFPSPSLADDAPLSLSSLGSPVPSLAGSALSQSNSQSSETALVSSATSDHMNIPRARSPAVTIPSSPSDTGVQLYASSPVDGSSSALEVRHGAVSASASYSPNSSVDGTPTRRSWRSLSKIMSPASSAVESPSSITSQACCDQCQTKFGLLRWRYVCRFCMRELCRSCFDADPSRAKKDRDSASATRDASTCAVCLLATNGGGGQQPKT